MEEIHDRIRLLPLQGHSSTIFGHIFSRPQFLCTASFSHTILGPSTNFLVQHPSHPSESLRHINFSSLSTLQLPFSTTYWGHGRRGALAAAAVSCGRTWSNPYLPPNHSRILTPSWGLAGVVHWQPPQSALDAAAHALQDPATSQYGPCDGLPQLVRALEAKVAVENSLPQVHSPLFPFLLSSRALVHPNLLQL